MKNNLALEHFKKSSRNYDYIQNYIHIAKIKLRHDKIKEVKPVIKDKLNKYPDNSELLELYSLILLKDGRIDDAQYFARKCLKINSNSLPALEIMAETCRAKNNYDGAISYWKLVRMYSSQNAYANLALIELYKKNKDTKMLDQEIRFLFHLQGSEKLNEYIRQLNKDEMLIVYVPKIENYSFITGKCSFIN